MFFFLGNLYGEREQCAHDQLSMAGEYEWWHELDGYYGCQCGFLYDLKCADVAQWQSLSLFVVEQHLCGASSFECGGVDGATAAFGFVVRGTVNWVVARAANGSDSHAFCAHGGHV